MSPVPCEPSENNGCYCHYNQDVKVNIYNCSSSRKTSLPNSVLKNTDWLIMQNSLISQLCDWSPYLNGIQDLNVNNNYIKTVCESFIGKLSHSNITVLDLSYNNLTIIPDTYEQACESTKAFPHRKPLPL